MAKVYQIVCDQCGSAKAVGRYELRTPSGRYSMDLCSKHGTALESQAKELAPSGQQPLVRGRPKRTVYPLDAEGNPVLPG